MLAKLIADSIASISAHFSRLKKSYENLLLFESVTKTDKLVTLSTSVKVFSDLRFCCKRTKQKVHRTKTSTMGHPPPPEPMTKLQELIHMQ